MVCKINECAKKILTQNNYLLLGVHLLLGVQFIHYFFIPLSCMNPLINFQVVRLCYRLWTNSTSTTEQFLASINSLMYFQIATSCKGQRVKLNGFSPVWILVCAFRVKCCAKDLGQRVQLYGLSYVWILKWLMSSDELPKDVSHNEQLNSVSPV